MESRVDTDIVRWKLTHVSWDSTEHRKTDMINKKTHLSFIR